jgi:hypothetical protein
VLLPAAATLATFSAWVPKRAPSVIGFRGGRFFVGQRVICRDVIELHTCDGCGLQELPARPVMQLTVFQ